MAWLHRRVLLHPFLALVLVLVPVRVAAQSTGTTTGDLAGRVTDDKGLPLPGVQVTATNRETGLSRSVITDGSGEYELPLLSPGLYRVRTELALFMPVVTESVRVTIGTTTPLDVALGTTPTAEAEVVVTAETSLIDSQKTDLATTVDNSKIQNLPNVPRNFLSFSLLTPRVSEDRGPQSGAAATSGISINGFSPRYNYLAVDGFDNNDGGNGSVRAQFSQDAVQEYQVITNPYAAEYGRVAGGVINIVTRSGTNRLKGGVFGFYRSDALSASDPITGETVPLEDLRAGLSIGGPLVKDKTFLFAAYERGQTDTANPVAIASDDVTLIRSKGFAIENGNVDYEARADALVVKLDHELSQSQFLTLRGNWSKGLDENQQPWGGLVARSAGGERDATDLTGAVGLTSVFGARTFNELRVLYSDNDYTVDPLDEARGVSVTIQGVATFGTQRLLPQPRTTKILQLFDSFSFQPGGGPVQLKVGADYYRVDIEGELPIAFAGLYRFVALPPSTAFPQGLTARQAFAAGVPAVFAQAFGDAKSSGNASHLGLFAQAEVHLGRQLLLRIGGRYDAEQPVDPLPSSNNFAPRASFSWAPTDSFRVKGGAGRFFGVTALGPEFAVGILDGVKVRTLARTIQGGPSPLVPWNILPARRFPDEASAGSSIVPPTVLRPGEFESARTDMANLGFELDVAKSVLFSVDAVYARGSNVFVARNVNPITKPDSPPSQQRPNPAFSDIYLYESTGSSWYRAGTLGLASRLGGPVEVSAYYTYADAEDDYLDWLTEYQPQDPLNPADERGPSSQSPKHKLAVAGIWSTVGRPGSWWARDWAFALTFDLRAGLPYNVTAGYDRNRNGDPLSDRPEGVGRNSETLPNQYSLDLRLARTLRLGGDFTAELIAVCTNVTNHENAVAIQSVQNQSSFGQPTLYGPGRIFQLGARLNF